LPPVSEHGGHQVRSARARWGDLALVAVVGILARLILLVAAPGALSFPDTTHYLQGLFAPGHAAHISLVPYLWWLGSLGHYTWRTVAAFQVVAGLLAAVALADGLLRLVRRWCALVAALGFATFLPVLGFERVFLVESICVDLGALVLWALVRCLRATSNSHRAAWGMLGVAGVTTLVLVRPALLLAGALAVLMTLLILISGLHGRRRLAWSIGVTVAALVLVGVPLGLRAQRNQQDFGIFSLTPTSGAYMMARWAPVIPCPRLDQQLTYRARTLLWRACQHDQFGVPPGAVAKGLWEDTEYLGATKLDANRAWEVTTQQELSAAVRSALLHHPGTVAAQVADSLWYQAFEPPADDLAQYLPGPTPYTIRSFGFKEPGTSNLHRFYGTAHLAQGGPNRLRSALQLSYRWTQYLGWVVLGLGLGLLIAGAARRRLRWRALGTPGGLAAIASTGFVLGSMLDIAFGSYPIFRYLIPLAPWLFALLALELDGVSSLASKARPSAAAGT
jgi:hypothetical protein